MMKKILIFSIFVVGCYSMPSEPRESKLPELVKETSDSINKNVNEQHSHKGQFNIGRYADEFSKPIKQVSETIQKDIEEIEKSEVEKYSESHTKLPKLSTDEPIEHIGQHSDNSKKEESRNAHTSTHPPTESKIEKPLSDEDKSISDLE